MSCQSNLVHAAYQHNGNTRTSQTVPRMLWQRLLWTNVSPCTKKILPITNPSKTIRISSMAFDEIVLRLLTLLELPKYGQWLKDNLARKSSFWSHTKLCHAYCRFHNKPAWAKLEMSSRFKIFLCTALYFSWHTLHGRIFQGSAIHCKFFHHTLCGTAKHSAFNLNGCGDNVKMCCGCIMLLAVWLRYTNMSWGN